MWDRRNWSLEITIMYLWMAETIFQLFLMLSYVLLSNNHNFYPLPNCSSKKSYFKKITLLISVRVGNFWTVFRKVDFCLTALKVWAHCQLAPSTNVVVEDCGKGNCLAQCIWEQERSGRDRGREWGMRCTILPQLSSSFYRTHRLTQHQLWIHQLFVLLIMLVLQWSNFWTLWNLWTH